MQRLGRRQHLSRQPAARRLAMHVLARHRRQQAQSRVGELHREVRPQRQRHAGLDEAAPGVGTGQPRLAEAVAGPAHVGGRVRGLHRGHQLQAGKARDVARRDHLRMLDAPAMVARGLVAQHARVGVEHDAVAAVADGMRRHLQSAVPRAAHGGLEAGLVLHQQAAIAGIVAVVLDQRGAAAAQRAVDHQLDAAHVQAPGRMPVRTVAAHRLDRVRAAAGIGLHAHAERATVGEALHQREAVVAGAHVVHAGQAEAGHVLQRAREGLFLPGRVRLRRGRVDQVRGHVDEHARGLAVLAHHQATVGLPVAGEVAVNRAHRGAVGPGGVPVDALQHHGPVGEGGVEHGRGRERGVGPQVLVPAAAHQPGVCRQVAREGLQPLDDLRRVARADQVGLHQRMPQPDQVRVRVDQARHHRGVTGIDALGVRMACNQLGRVAHRQDAAVRVPDHGRGHGHVRVGRVDAGRGEQAFAVAGGRGSGQRQQDAR